MHAKDRWQKILWRRQPFPDNYIPASFLSSLKKNSNFRPYEYWPLVLSACSITQHISTIFIFVNTFIRLYDGSWDSRVLVWLSVSMFVLGYVAWEVLEQWLFGFNASAKDRRAKTLKSSILVFLSLLALSPIFRTLTASTSSDSIWALSTFLFILNILLADYGPPSNPRFTRERLTSVLSINAAVSASIVLASRLNDDMSVFALMLFSIITFALFPLLRSRLLLSSRLFKVTITACLSISAVYLTSRIAWTITYIQGLSLAFITFGAPGVLLWAQKYKNEIRGPWDVAIPQIH